MDIKPQRVVKIFVILMFVVSGCSQPSLTKNETESIEASPAFELEKIGLLVVDDVTLGSLVERQWAARRDGEIEVHQISAAKFAQQDFELDSDIDVVIYPPGMIGELYSRSRITEIPKSVWDDKESVNKKALLRHGRSLHVRYGKRTMALPLGAPNLMFLYRHDVLEKLNVDVPDDWNQFERLIERLNDVQIFQNEEGEDLPTEIGFPLSNGFAAHMFLARAAPYARYRGKLSTVFERDSMEPLIATEPFVRALTELKATCELSDCALNKSPQDVYADLIDGKMAFGIAWPSAQQDSSGQISTNENIRIARLPGSRDWFEPGDRGWLERRKSESPFVEYVGFEGLVVSINAKSGRSISAQEFVKWLPGKSISLATIAGSHRSGPFRTSHLGNPIQWTGEAISPDAATEYADLVKTINDESVVLTFPRLPGRSEYLETLNDGVMNCLGGDMEPAEALQSVAEKWKAITESLGVLKQKANLARGQDF